MKTMHLVSAWRGHGLDTRRHQIVQFHLVQMFQYQTLFSLYANICALSSNGPTMSYPNVKHKTKNSLILLHSKGNNFRLLLKYFANIISLKGETF